MEDIVKLAKERFGRLQRSDVGAQASPSNKFDDFIRKMYRGRLNMYTTYGDTFALNPENVWKIMQILDVNGTRLANLDETTTDMKQFLRYLTKSGRREVPAEDIQKINALAPDVTISNQPKGGGGPEGQPDVEGPTKTIFDPYLMQMNDPKRLPTLDQDMEADPNVTPELQTITANDRIAFIAITFVIRMVCVFLVDWMISTGMVTNFKDAFLYYVVLYCLFVVFLTFVVSNNDIGLQMLVYYMNTEANGYSRIMLHMFFVIIFLPILFVIKDNAVTSIAKDTSFEYKQRISQSINGFTFITWLLTSLMALRF
jgi:hypothetical protein